MMEKINIKVVAIIITIILVITGIIVAFCIFGKSADKSYDLEEISEKDFKYYVVYTDGKYGVIDTLGNLIVENKYSNIFIPNPTKAVFIAINENGSKEVLNEKAEKIFTEYANVTPIETKDVVTNIPYEKSVLQYEENGKYGLINFAGEKVTDAIYEEISSVRYKEGEIVVKKDGKYGVINNKGVELIKPIYEDIEADKYYSDGTYRKSGYIVKIREDDGYKYGYINSKWETLLEPEYTDISRILDIDTNDVYLIVAKDRKIWRN